MCVVCEKQTHCVAGRHTARQHGVGGLLQGVATSTRCWAVWSKGEPRRGEGYSLSLSLSLSRCSFICLVRSFGLGFLAFLKFINFSQIFTQKFTFSRFYGLLRRVPRLAMTTIFTQNAFNFLKNLILKDRQ